MSYRWVVLADYRKILADSNQIPPAAISLSAIYQRSNTNVIINKF